MPPPARRDPKREKNAHFSQVHGLSADIARRSHVVGRRPRRRRRRPRPLVDTLWCTIGTRPLNSSPIRDNVVFVTFVICVCFHRHRHPDRNARGGHASRPLPVQRSTPSRVHTTHAPTDAQRDPTRSKSRPFRASPCAVSLWHVCAHRVARARCAPRPRAAQTRSHARICSPSAPPCSQRRASNIGDAPGRRCMDVHTRWTPDRPPRRGRSSPCDAIRNVAFWIYYRYARKVSSRSDGFSLSTLTPRAVDG